MWIKLRMPSVIMSIVQILYDKKKAEIRMLTEETSLLMEELPEAAPP